MGFPISEPSVDPETGVKRSKYDPAFLFDIRVPMGIEWKAQWVFLFLSLRLTPKPVSKGKNGTPRYYSIFEYIWGSDERQHGVYLFLTLPLTSDLGQKLKM